VESAIDRKELTDGESPNGHSTYLVASKILNDLFERYNERKKPLQIDFRKMVDWIAYGERSSHMIHLYPAKLLPHIPAFFLANDILSKPGDIVLDPFSGSGTVVLEALLAERVPVGADSNPLARLISKVKTTPIKKVRLERAYSKLRFDLMAAEPAELPNVINIDYWFHSHVISELSKINISINKIKNREIKDFFLVCFSNTIKRVSLADPRLSVPVKLNEKKYSPESVHFKTTEKLLTKLGTISAIEEFDKCVISNIERISNLTKKVGLNGVPLTLYEDARSLRSKYGSLKDSSVQLIITSPPYAGAQKYIRSSSLNLGWLGYCETNTLRDYEKKNIGREHHSKNEYSSFIRTGVKEADKILEKIYVKNPLRSYIAAKYIIEMKEALVESFRVLKKNGYLVLVAAPNEICGMKFETQKYLTLIAEKLGMSVELALIDEIHSRGLMTKRNKTASVINSEWIMVLKK